MVNAVKMAVQEAITAYSRLGWSKRKIARTLGVDRETVGRHLRLAGSKPAIVPAGTQTSNPAILPAGNDGSNPAIPPAGIVGSGPAVEPPAAGTSKVPTPGPSGRVSQCAPFKTTIETALEKGLSAQRIYQDLIAEAAFPGRYDAVKRYVRRLRGAAPERFWRLECPPGEEAQVDFGRGAPVRTGEGRPQKTWVFRIVLSYSR